MTREEAFNGLKESICAICLYGQDMNTCDIQECNERYFIKVLEQENYKRPTILDKIRDEIEQHIDKEKLNFGGQFDSGLNLALKIIDKYKSESEDKES